MATAAPSKSSRVAAGTPQNVPDELNEKYSSREVTPSAYLSAVSLPGGMYRSPNP